MNLRHYNWPYSRWEEIKKLALSIARPWDWSDDDSEIYNDLHRYDYMGWICSPINHIWTTDFGLFFYRGRTPAFSEMSDSGRVFWCIGHPYMITHWLPEPIEIDLKPGDIYTGPFFEVRINRHGQMSLAANEAFVSIIPSLKKYLIEQGYWEHWKKSNNYWLDKRVSEIELVAFRRWEQQWTLLDKPTRKHMELKILPANISFYLEDGISNLFRYGCEIGRWDHIDADSPRCPKRAWVEYYPNENILRFDTCGMVGHIPLIGTDLERIILEAFTLTYWY